jgi:hypothetical protein
MITDLFPTRAEKKNGHNFEPATSFRLGGRVQHHKFGTGVVRAFNPDGTLLVRFDGQAKSQPVFPTFLGRNIH